MKIEMFSQTYNGLMISANDFEFYLSRPALIVVASVALVVVALRRVKKLRDAR